MLKYIIRKLQFDKVVELVGGGCVINKASPFSLNSILYLVISSVIAILLHCGTTDRHTDMAPYANDRFSEK